MKENKMRAVAVINLIESNNVEENIFSYIPDDFEKYVFVDNDRKFNDSSIKVVKIPSDIVGHKSKMMNFVTKYFFDNNFKGFLHEIEENVEIFNEPSIFIDEIEKMMVALKQKSWLNTSCDQCNFVYEKYNPRLTTILDEDEYKDKFSGNVNWCSNANTAWMIYNYDIATYDDVKFDENFSFAMYYIIKFLAERRNLKLDKELYYMNLYPSVQSELKVFKTIDIEDKQNKYIQFNEEIIRKEDELYKSMNINNSPDSDFVKLVNDIHNFLI